MTTRSPKPRSRASLPMLAATTAALPAVVLSSLAIAPPAAAESRPRTAPATTDAALRTQTLAPTAASQASAFVPAGTVSATIPSAFQAAAPSEYTIARGDTISAIAARFGLDTYSVLKLNKLSASTIIYPGQKIKLSDSATTTTPAATTPAATTPATAAPAATAKVHTVKPGDTLSAIAAQYDVKLAEVFSWNGLGMSSIIYPGQKVKVGATAATPAPVTPAPATTTPATPAATTTTTSSNGSYTIVSGDTLSGIAAKNGVKLSDVLAANRMTMSTIIYPGQKLVIPGGSIAPASSTPTPVVSPLVPSTFLGYTYPTAVVSSANVNKALLNAAPVPSREQMKAIVADTARSMGVDPALALAFAFQESGFDQRAVSPANAIGTMQVIPSSGTWASDLVGRQLNLLDPYDNVTAGVAIIRQLVRTSKDLDHAIAGYYQGQYSVNTIGMYEDTKNYVAAINAHRVTFS